MTTLTWKTTYSQIESQTDAGTAISHPLLCSQLSPQLGQDQAEESNQEFSLSFPLGCQGLRYLSHHWLLPGYTLAGKMQERAELALKPGHSDKGHRCPRCILVTVPHVQFLYSIPRNNPMKNILLSLFYGLRNWGTDSVTCPMSKTKNDSAVFTLKAKLTETLQVEPVRGRAGPYRGTTALEESFPILVYVLLLRAP